MDLDEDDEDIIKQSKSKGRGNAKVFCPVLCSDCSLTRSQPAKRPTLPEARTGSSSTGIGLLTAAERRVQTKKDEKKDAEQPYSFLQDIKDVSIPESFTLYAHGFYRKMAFGPVKKAMIHVLYIFPRKHRRPLRPSKFRFVFTRSYFFFFLTLSQFWDIKQNHYDTVSSQTVYRPTLTVPGAYRSSSSRKGKSYPILFHGVLTYSPGNSMRSTPSTM